jgi:hypothetical protein
MPALVVAIVSLACGKLIVLEGREYPLFIRLMR